MTVPISRIYVVHYCACSSASVVLELVLGPAVLEIVLAVLSLVLGPAVLEVVLAVLSLVLRGHLAVLHCPAARHVGLEGEVMLSEGPGVDDLAAEVLCGERLVLVGRHHQVWQRVEVEGAVVVPVHGAGVQGQGGQVALQGGVSRSRSRSRSRRVKTLKIRAAG